MTKKKQILEVDIIGGQGTLTVAEEKALHDYFQRTKSNSSAKPKVKTKAESKRKYSTV
ncbi:MAG: hypothetical protein IPK88_09395 [Saprospiraceae bacterium]|jgi:hypothetical protein|uniref:Uncharacterized protein n=1 Tax=Candidatus Defluviibacterium haderslevense TaxID=2981993 RepID=A0A9D7SC26_9BACT|nr:hypothetical protein [Candidatus Defluviibacterium haderslevense]MBK8243621.1 hypothetical protein [Candidatus Defluviibacterium haderslevense]MBK8243629.1 hypothetical protein [Candidatus Defluviibacterium haderslevense]MBK9718912.1 hypothetical protein [Candidatus Defluviibacterium haderslevense]MBL0235697.1 hypothetical protein [Candidatus Defluviibacterium haderslevense]